MNINKRLRALSRKGFSVRFLLSGVVAAILIPALLFGGWLTLHSADAERTLLERNSGDKAAQVVTDIDDDIAAAKATLIALANSHFLQVNDFQSFHRQCAEVAKQLGGQIVLRDTADGHQIINSVIAWGRPLPENNAQQALEAMNEAIRTGAPSISNVFFGPSLKKFIVNVGIPIESTRYFLAVGIPVHAFADSLQGAALPANWIISLVDSNDTIIARSDRNELTGSKLNNSELATRVLQDGFAIGNNRDGIAYRWVARRSDLTGWLVYVGIPVSELEAPARRALITYSAASSLLFILAMALSFFFGERVSRSFGEMGIDRTPTREEFHILFESAPNGVLVADNDGLIVLANERLERQFGYARGELIGRGVELLVPERFRGGHLSLDRTFGGSSEFRPMGRERELLGRRKDGSEFRIEIGLNPITTTHGNFVMATIVDVTERILAENRLFAAQAERDDLRRNFMRAQEGERLRLARELHDQTGQALTGAMLELKDLELRLKGEERNRARALRKSMEQMGKTLHRVAWELRPASIDELGLTSALANYVSEWGRQYAIEADFLCRDLLLDSIADEKRTAIYRIVQEALTNVAKHAHGATTVSVVVDRSNSTLQLTVEDNGSGMDANASGKRPDGGLGLAGLRERLTLIGGQLEIESSPDAGTTIFARVPVGEQRLIA